MSSDFGPPEEGRSSRRDADARVRRRLKPIRDYGRTCKLIVRGGEPLMDRLDLKPSQRGAVRKLAQLYDRYEPYLNAPHLEQLDDAIDDMLPRESEMNKLAASAAEAVRRYNNMHEYNGFAQKPQWQL